LRNIVFYPNTCFPHFANFVWQHSQFSRCA